MARHNKPEFKDPEGFRRTTTVVSIGNEVESLGADGMDAARQWALDYAGYGGEWGRPYPIEGNGVFRVEGLHYNPLD
jgi:hypothetical protein